jgi:replicative DNA helicase
MSDFTVEHTVLENLINSDEYFRAVIPHIKEEYFDSRVEQTLVKFIQAFSEKHNKAPNQRILSLMAKEYTGFSQDEYVEAKEYIDVLSGKEENTEWLLERTEKFCKDKAVYNSIMQAIQILDGKDEKFNKEAIPSILQEALSISFDRSVGHNYFENAEERFDFYSKKEDKIPFRLDYLNKITSGGASRGTLQAALAGVNVGKSIFLCDLSAGYLSMGYNVLYITLEMAEEKIAERIDCNLLDIEIDNLHKMSKADFLNGVKGIESKSHGKLVIKEFPTGGAHVGHFRALIDELKVKQNFKPDVICVDYINICASQKYKSNNYQSYQAVKAIAEELRGMMMELNCVGWTATQLTRAGLNNSDFDMADTSESIGLPATLDMFLGIIRTEELDKMGQLMFKQLKSRYGDLNRYKKFLIGIDIHKFRLYDIPENQQGSLDDAGYTDSTSPRKAQFDVSEINFD